MGTIDEPTAKRLAAWANYERLREAVATATRALGPGVSVAPLKGMWVCASGLRHPADRPMRDADLLLAGVPLLTAALRLRRVGFVLADVPRAPYALSMRLGESDAPSLDLHTRPLPPGLGRLSTATLLAGARRDETVFGVPVLLAAPRLMAVQLIGNVLKDRVVRASEHAASDLVTVLASAPDMPARVAEQLGRAGLLAGGAVVVRWARGHADHRALAELGADLERRGAGARRAGAVLERLHRLESEGSRRAQLIARGIGDRRPDRAVAIAAAGLMNAMHPLRTRVVRRLLTA